MTLTNNFFSNDVKKKPIKVQSKLVPDSKPSWIPPFLRKKVSPDPNNNVKTKNLNETFCEHTWDISRTSQNFPTSCINIQNPNNSQGLSTDNAKKVLEHKGLNMLPKPKEISNIQLFIQQFLNMLWALLITATIFSLIGWFTDISNLSGLWVTIIMFLMIIVLCTISFYQERKARMVVKAFENLLPEKSNVIRDGQEISIDACFLVQGDIIKIKSGSRVPADARILSCVGLKLETSSITGEAEPIEYQAEPVPESTTVFDAKNIAFNGSLVVDGEGVGIVIKTGNDTVIGQIASMTRGQDEKKSRLQMQIKKYVKILVVVAGVWGGGCFIIGGFVHKWHNPVSLLANAFLTIAISIVPCGLPATVTSSLTLVAQRLVKKNVYLKKLDIVEALGSANIIASDKTGTLTQNIMTVTDVWHYDKLISGHPDQTSTSSAKKSLKNYEPPLSNILTVMSVCNSANFVEDSKPKSIAVNMTPIESDGKKHLANQLHAVQHRPAVGTPSEVAMLQYADMLVSVEDTRSLYESQIVFEIPFNSKRKWHLMIAKIRNLENGQSEYLLMMKGAPEVLIQKCSMVQTQKGDIDLEKEELAKFQDTYEKFGANGRRVIGFVQKTFISPSDVTFSVEAENYPQKGLTFLGVCAIMDPPREETAGAIKMCKEAGIKVFMVTGDHHLTATAIAKEIGLIEDKPGQPQDYTVLHGERISNLSEQEWDQVLGMKAVVFARTTPEQKLLIVEQCQKRKQVIAMTGDGVNDAPALKKAHIGVAMGTGSDVAKQAADIVLTDDNFASIVKAVEEGRLMYDNLKKLLGYTMCHTWPEVWSIVVNFCFGMPIGMTALQILAIDLGTEIPPGIAMAKEGLEGDIMKRPPRNSNKVLVSNSLLGYSYLWVGQLQSLGCFLAYCCVFWSYGINISDLWMSAIDSWKGSDSAVFASNGKSYSSDEQIWINRQASAAWQMGIVFGQCFHMFSSRTLRQSIFTHGFFSNWWSLVAIVVELIMLGIFIYVPKINEFLGGAPISWLPWCVVAGMGLLIFVYNEIRKIFIRKWPENKLVSILKW